MLSFSADSDMATLGYSFKVFKEGSFLADGPSILKYVKETASEFGIDKNIQYNTKVNSLSWSSKDNKWTIESSQGTYSANFVFLAIGYYDYDQGYLPDWPTLSNFKGQVIHPQKWPKDLDYTDKEVIVIGSGATAVTIVPAMAEKVKHITMLQRSPTYIVSRPNSDGFANFVRRWLPEMWAFTLIRWQRVLFGIYFFNLCMKAPKAVADGIIKMVKDALPADYDVQKHFTPRYNPWQQRMCLIPDGDLWKAINTGKASVVTDTIEEFVPEGIKISSGETLKADMIVTATGLKMNLMSSIPIEVDGKKFVPGEALTYKGMMFSGLPNLALATGYTNASWTLKCELSCKYTTRLLNYMDDNNLKSVTPTPAPDEPKEDFFNFTSGYVQRVIKQLPKSGTKAPWKVYQNYIYDLLALSWGKVVDTAVVFRS